MSEKTFPALIVEESGDSFTRRVGEKAFDDLPDHDVLIKVEYSSLNYKDALSATGNKGVTRQFPHTPGIDAAGVVVESKDVAFKAGDPVLVTGYDLGQNTSGGFGQYIRVPAEWIVPLPNNLTTRESMIYGTAGFTAGLSVRHIQQVGVMPDAGDVVVTGATGGVGSIAVALLARQGYSVTAVTGKPAQTAYLKSLGAANVVGRDEVDDQSGRPLLKQRWAGGIDSVGGDILSTILRATKHRGAVAACGLAKSSDLTMTVFPFILRGVSLLGVNSADTPMAVRRDVWTKLAGEWHIDQLNMIADECSLAEVEAKIDEILEGKITGRTLVKLP